MITLNSQYIKLSVDACNSSIEVLEEAMIDCEISDD
jgi:hypothetical protein